MMSDVVTYAQKLRDEIASLRAHAEQLSSDYDMIAVQNAGLRAENERLREALRLGADMRSAQSAYFKTKTKDALIASKVAESDFDKICRAALKENSDEAV